MKTETTSQHENQQPETKWVCLDVHRQRLIFVNRVETIILLEELSKRKEFYEEMSSMGFIIAHT